MTLKGKKEVVDAYKGKYRKANRLERVEILDKLEEVTGLHRKSLSRALRRGSGAKRKPRKVSPGRPRIYVNILTALETVWKSSNFLCGKRLKAILPLYVERLMSCGELKISAEEKELLLSVSAATIDRMLKPARKRFELRGRTTTKPGTLLKHQIPIRTFAEWDNTGVGFMEVDLVAHCGGTARGDFLHSLTATDVASGWTVCDAFRGKGQLFCLQAIERIRTRLPFSLLGLDSDNGSEFINHHLKKYCEDKKITFTRGRPYKKNDQCHVEQKNWNVVRRFLGYGRYENDEQLAAVRDIHSLVELYQNFFQPSSKLIEKRREGAKLYRRHDSPTTPARRLLANPEISEETKERLRHLEDSLNPAKLLRDILKKMDELESIG